MNIYGLFLGASAFCAALLVPAHGQDINFKDLNRTGPAVVKNYTVSGVAAEGSSYLQKFDGVDSSRLASAREARQNAAASYQTNSSANNTADSSSNKSAAKQPAGPTSKQFVCTVYCKSTSGPTVQHELQASSRSEAARATGQSSDQICRSRGFANSSSASFPDSQCRER